MTLPDFIRKLSLHNFMRNFIFNHKIDFYYMWNQMRKEGLNDHWVYNQVTLSIILEEKTITQHFGLISNV